MTDFISRSPFSWQGKTKQYIPLLLVLISVLFALGSYLQALNYQFDGDDLSYVSANKKLMSLPTRELWRLLVEPYNPYEYLPLRDLSYWLDGKLFGVTPSVFRIHNLLLYAMCCIFCYVATVNVWKYFQPADQADAPWIAAIITSLFALHPAHAEAVVNISGLKDVMSGMFSLMAVWLAVIARRERGLSPLLALLTLAALGAAMLSKGVAVAVAVVISVLWLLFWRDSPAATRNNKQLLWPMASLLMALLWAAVFSHFSAIKAPAYFGIEAIERTLSIMGWLARLSISPESRHFFYPVMEESSLPVMMMLGIATLICAAGGMAILLKQRSLPGFCLMIFVLLCIPYMQLFPNSVNSLASDRFLFVAAWPITFLIVALAWRLRPLPALVLLTTIALSWAYQSYDRPKDWKNFVSVVKMDLRAYPGFYLPSFYYIKYALLPQGRLAEAVETANAISDPAIRDTLKQLLQSETLIKGETVSPENADQAISLLKDYGAKLVQPPVRIQWDTPVNFVWWHFKDLLLQEWNNLDSRYPDNVFVKYNAGISLMGIQFYKPASQYLLAAVRSHQLPGTLQGDALKNLGILYRDTHHLAEAEAALLAALELPGPEQDTYCALTAVYKKMGRLSDADKMETKCRK